MEKPGLKNSTADFAYFIARTHEDSFLYIAIYVDDGHFLATRMKKLKCFKGYCKKNYNWVA
jgi:hypothetical protein